MTVKNCFGGACLLWLTLSASSGASLPINYSWSGLIVPAGSDDPWLIGSQGKSFDLGVTVASNAQDLLPTDVPTAGFDVLGATLSIDGASVAYVGFGTLEFQDNVGNIADLLTFNGSFAKFGQTLEIGSNVAIPTNSFQFANLIEFPPSFATTTSSDQASCCGTPYVTVVPAGTIVKVEVPEPGTFSLFAAVLAYSSCKRFRRT